MIAKKPRTGFNICGFRWIVGAILSVSFIWGSVQLYKGKSHFGGRPTKALSDEKVSFLLAKQKHKTEHPKRYDKPKEAQEYYAMKRAPIGRLSLPVEQYGVAMRHMAQMRRHSVSDSTLSSLPLSVIQDASENPFTGIWESLGPGNVGGRTRALLFDPDNPSTIYAAGVSGGVWKSIDAGANWVPLTDLIANLAVNSMAMDPLNSALIYAGTGEGYFNSDFVRGDGIFKTADGGLTWTQLINTADNTDFHYVNDLVISPNNSQVVYAATRTGIFRSDDAGGSWAQVQSSTVRGGCLDLAIRTDQALDQVFASCGTNETATVYKSTNAGSTWQAVLSESNMGRTALAIAPSNQDIVYALSASIELGSKFRDGLHAVFRSTDGGDNWTAQVRNTDTQKLNTVLLTNPLFAFFPECSSGSIESFFNQGWYDNVIAVDPVDPNVVWAGGIDLFRSDDAGVSWGLGSYWWDSTVPQYVHADHHAIVFHPSYDGATNRQMLVGSDGGVFRTDNARAPTATGSNAPCEPSSTGLNWVNLNNGYGVTQFYHGAVYPDGLTYFGGTQDNGTIRGNQASGPNTWVEILGGDGGFVAVDPNDINILFAELGGDIIRKSTDGGEIFLPASTGITESISNFLFIAPFEMDPGNSKTLWTGGFYLWRTADQAESWVQVSTLIPGIGSVSALAISPTNSNAVIAGMSDGWILHTRSGLSANETTSWITVKPVSGWISSLAFDPKDDQVVYATVSTFGVDHVWKSVDAGTSWQAIDQRDQPNGIPDIPVHSIVINPNDTAQLFLGTDLGVFVSSDGGQSWMVENTGFANVVTEKLVLNNHNDVNTLYAFTHGRGTFRVQLSGSSGGVGSGGGGNSDGGSSGGGGGCALNNSDTGTDPLFLFMLILAWVHVLRQQRSIIFKVL